jgi:ABC-type polysaccharide/polyol phosphate export permease
MHKGSNHVAVSDVISAVKRYSLVGMLGWQDVRQRYRRSALGPFWLTLSMGVMIGTIGIVFGQIFKTPMKEYLPFLSAGLIIWTFIFSVISEGCSSFIAAEGIIKQLPIPLFVHVLRMIWRNVLIFAHNIVIFPLAMFAVGRSPDWVMLMSIPGFLLVVINLAWLSLMLGVLCARYRDLPQIIASVLQVLFYLTPVMWMPHLLNERTGLYLLDFNPVYHMLEVVRAPLLNQMPSASNWMVVISIAVIGWSIALVIYGRYKHRIPYWL